MNLFVALAATAAAAATYTLGPDAPLAQAIDDALWVSSVEPSGQIGTEIDVKTAFLAASATSHHGFLVVCKTESKFGQTRAPINHFLGCTAAPTAAKAVQGLGTDVPVLTLTELFAGAAQQ